VCRRRRSCGDVHLSSDSGCIQIARLFSVEFLQLRTATECAALRGGPLSLVSRALDRDGIAKSAPELLLSISFWWIGGSRCCSSCKDGVPRRLRLRKGMHLGPLSRAFEAGQSSHVPGASTRSRHPDASVRRIAAPCPHLPPRRDDCQDEGAFVVSEDPPGPRPPVSRPFVPRFTLGQWPCMRLVPGDDSRQISWSMREHTFVGPADRRMSCS
jgi:hypothetical protein